MKRHPITEILFVRTPEFIASAVLSLILLYFLLVYDQIFIAKLVKLLPTLSDKKDGRRHRARHRIADLALSIYNHSD